LCELVERTARRALGEPSALRDLSLHLDPGSLPLEEEDPGKTDGARAEEDRDDGGDPLGQRLEVAPAEGQGQCSRQQHDSPVILAVHPIASFSRSLAGRGRTRPAPLWSGP